MFLGLKWALTIKNPAFLFQARWSKSEAFLLLPIIQLSLVCVAAWTSMTRFQLKTIENSPATKTNLVSDEAPYDTKLKNLLSCLETFLF